MLLLATNYPVIYWNCACLITNSGGNEDAEIDELDNTEIIVPDGTKLSEIEKVKEETDEEETDDDEDDDDEDDEPKEKKKKKVKNTNYGKIATAIGQIQNLGISVSPPNINKSSYSFLPDVNNNTILYGIKGINRIGDDLIQQIISKRPYTSIYDFLSKVKVTKPQMINLIKSGAFDIFGDRENIMEEYIISISDKKNKLNLQNMQMLINYDLIPKEFDLEKRIYNFNKYLKKNKVGTKYELVEYAKDFFEKNFDIDLLTYEIKDGESIGYISQLVWDRIYKKSMDPIRDYIKSNMKDLLNNLNSLLIGECKLKYCKGNLSKWEMDSISFYYHDHELMDIDEEEYEIVNYFNLPEDPIIDKIIDMKGKKIPLYKLSKIAGTILDKDKNKSQLTILTKYGVVNVKIYGQTFAKYDKQISQKLDTGKKKVIEKSFFTRGNKIIITGVRNGDTFLAKKYKNSDTFLIGLITEIFNNKLVIQTERTEVN